MTDDKAIERWNRKLYQHGGYDADVLYCVFGDFKDGMEMSSSEYRSRGLPGDVGVTAYRRDGAVDRVSPIYAGYIGDVLESSNPVLFNAVNHASCCLLVRGMVKDPTDLVYLRDVVGFLTALLDHGGVALLDWQAFRWFGADEWTSTFYSSDVPDPTNHVSIFITPEGTDEIVWIHTRGMRKFGRPDFSARGVTIEDQAGVVDLCNRFISMCAFGAVVPDGQAVRVKSLSDGLVCRHAGSLDDPEFNNFHIEIAR